MICATYDYNQNAMRSRGQMGDYILSDFRDLESFFIDAHFKLKGFSFFGEYANRKTRNGLAVVNGVYDNTLDEYIISGITLNVISLKQTIIPGLTISRPGQNGTFVILELNIFKICCHLTFSIHCQVQSAVQPQATIAR